MSFASWKPQRTKFRRLCKGVLKSVSFSETNNSLKFGWYGLQSLGSARLSAKQLEATRRMVSRSIRKKEKLWIRAFPDIPVTTKPIQIRMGKGKGAVDHWIHKLPAGKIILEIGAMPEVKAKAILMSAAKKLGVACNFVNRQLDRF
jgi:large subunit ribosomal protein L16